MDGIDQIQVDWRHDLGYPEAIRAILRMDPDIILVGEVRDALSAQAAIRAALSGRVVLSTLHARDAVATVSVLRHWQIPDHEIAGCLQLVIAQRLVRRLCTACRFQRHPTDREAAWAQRLGATLPHTVWDARGCDACAGLGYQGRTGVFEVWPLTESDLRLIDEHHTETRLREAFSQRGHASLIHSGLDCVHRGVTSVEEFARLCGLFVPV